MTPDSVLAELLEFDSLHYNQLFDLAKRFEWMGQLQSDLQRRWVLDAYAQYLWAIARSKKLLELEATSRALQTQLARIDAGSGS
jgi:hypothetical protein